MTDPSYSVVVPTVGRPSLSVLLAALRSGTGPAPVEVVVVDDRAAADPPLDPGPGVRVVRSGGRGPAAARNAGALLCTAEWVAFLDDDVLPPPDWAAALVRDLAGLGAEVAGSQGRIVVPLPADRRPTDWERGTAGLAGARWATADMAYRRSVLERVGGFDERFPRAYREDAELALRVLGSGYALVRGEREITHPVRPSDRWASVRQQRGNADDVLIRRLHGPSWRERASVPTGRFRRHVAVTAAGLTGLAGLAGLLGLVELAGRAGPGDVRPAGGLPRNRIAVSDGHSSAHCRPGRWGGPARGGLRRVAGLLGAAGAAGWLAGTAEFARARIAPGPRTAAEVATMLATSAVIPPAAVAHRLRGELTHRRVRPWSPPPLAVLFDRDGTLVHDVPYNGDPALVTPVDGAADALAWLRGRGVPVGVVTNQSAVGRGMITMADVAAVNARVGELLGPFDDWQVCPHAPADGCGCRKPRPGMVLAAAERLGVPADRLVVIGDIGADVGAAHAAGARAVLVPTRTTRPEEIAAAPAVAPDLLAAVRLALAGGAR